MARHSTIVALGMMLFAVASPIRAAEKPTLTFDHFYDGPAVEKALRELHEAYPGLTRLEAIGKSEEGRDIWVLTINNTQTGSDADKPAVYVDGAIHGNEIQATEVCLYLAWYLLDGYDRVEMIEKLVDHRAFYIVPIVNVDNRARFFEEPGGYNIGRTGSVAYDDDRDGVSDEDGYEDIDGDGEVLRMRVKDPFGTHKTHPDDPRVMVRIKPGEKAEWRTLGSEGIDNDGDGRINEDPLGYLDMNRNYGFKWQPPYVQRGAGDFPMSGNVTRAVSAFVISKPNICFNVALHNSGGLIVRGPGSKLAGMYSPRDIKVYDFLGKEGEKIIPGYRYIIGGKDMYTTHGDFDEWMFSNLGIFGFVGELFMSSQERYRKPDEKKAGDQPDEAYFSGTPEEEKQKFNDRVNQGTMFKAWTKFDHPQLGEVEIGGWRTFTTRIPPTFMLPEMVHRNASLIIFIARQAPEVELETIDVESLGGDLHRIRVRAMNRKAIPTMSSNAARKNLVRKDILSIVGEGIEVVSGGIVQDLLLDRVDYVEHRPHMVFTTIPSFGKQDVQWIVKGSGTVTVTFQSVKATDRTLNLEL